MKRTFSILLILALLSGSMVWQSAAWEEEDSIITFGKIPPRRP